MIINRFIHSINRRGIAYTIHASFQRIRRLFPMNSSLFRLAAEDLRGKSGFEIGGPSEAFASRGIFPVYRVANNIDNCNFGSETIWEGNIHDGYTFEFDKRKPKGRQYIAEATKLDRIPSNTYDFVLSSHALEHTANPILALTEWIRILKDGGTLVMILPHKDGTFDHRRPVTPLSHMQEDYDVGMKEDDLTHYPEILAMHDFELDPESGGEENFKQRSLRNYENRCLHHHVFDTKSAVELVNHLGMQIIGVDPVYPMHIVIVAKKIRQRESVNNDAFMVSLRNILRRSPFRSDHICSVL